MKVKRLKRTSMFYARSGSNPASAHSPSQIPCPPAEID